MYVIAEVLIDFCDRSQENFIEKGTNIPAKILCFVHDYNMLKLGIDNCKQDPDLDLDACVIFTTKQAYLMMNRKNINIAIDEVCFLKCWRFDNDLPASETKH